MLFWCYGNEKVKTENQIARRGLRFLFVFFFGLAAPHSANPNSCKAPGRNSRSDIKIPAPGYTRSNLGLNRGYIRWTPA